MSERANYFKIGLFVLAASTLVVAGIIILGAAALFQDEILVETYFQETVQGLDIGSPVKFRGVQIGRVETMTTVRKEYDTEHRYVLVRMALLPETFMPRQEIVSTDVIKAEVEHGLRVRLGFQGVTGAAYIEADYLDPLRYPPLAIDWQPQHPYIPASPSLINRIGDAVDGILRNLEAINIQGIAGSLGKTLEMAAQTLEGLDVAELSGQLQGLLKELRQTNQHVDALVQDLDFDPLLQEASATFQQLRRTVEKVDPALQQLLLEATAAAENLRQITDQVGSGEDLAEAAAHLRQAMRRLDQLVAGQQPEIEAAVENLRAISDNLRETSENLRQNPSQVLFGEPPPRRFPGGDK
ncbi:MAG: MCE family protein [Desulfuromonadales bacterium]|nr:MCE family protein [Desulfuromonadales bacterium]